MTCISVSKSRSRYAILERLGLEKMWKGLGLRLVSNKKPKVSMSGLNGFASSF